MALVERACPRLHGANRRQVRQAADHRPVSRLDRVRPRCRCRIGMSRAGSGRHCGMTVAPNAPIIGFIFMRLLNR
jgi:hypothetical protein